MIMTAGTLVGGIGLFLLAMKMITDGLKLAAGDALRGILGDWTRNPARGIASGAVITSLVQSSSAVTVATIGFVNAGLLTLYQALGVVYGANIGTTMTGWLVAAMGFDIRVELFALPMVGAGMLLTLTGPRQRRGALGEALAGFGLFFIGIDVLREGFGGMTASIDLQQLSPEGVGGLLLFVWIGFIMTMLMQSSSAAIALILTAAGGALLSLYGAAALVIGANIGTTSTAALAAIGATPNARRVAAAHIAFNAFTAAVALALLPLMLWLVQLAAQVLRLELAPAVALALFHTVFNLLGVLLLWPLTRRLANWLERHFQTREEVAGRPQYLDKTVAETPSLALRALALELCRLSALARTIAGRVVTEPSWMARQLDAERNSAERLVLAIGEFVASLQRRALSATVADQLAQVLRAANYFLSVAETAQDVASYSGVAGKVAQRELLQMLKEYRTSIARFLFRADPRSAGFQSDDLQQNAESIVMSYQPLKRAVLIAGASSQVRISELGMLLEYIRGLRTVVEQAEKGSRDVAELLAATGSAAGESAVPASAGQDGEQLPEAVGDDLHGDGGQDQAEQTIENAQADRPEGGADRRSETQHRPE
jgi:phosphate:Na+ symporter